jgi:hypothetical protein
MRGGLIRQVKNRDVSKAGGESCLIFGPGFDCP